VGWPKVIASERDVKIHLQCELYIPGGWITYETYTMQLACYVFAARFVRGADVLDIGTGSGYMD
jgi:protein-L-isoaspartate O-methyltransferase